MKTYIFKNINKIYFKLLFLIVSLFFLSKILIPFEEIIGDNWAYSNLLINYSSGFVKRGLLGQIFIYLNNNFNTEPELFFTIIFFTAYSLQIFFFYKILEKYQNYKFIVTIIILSPCLLLFHIYDLNIILAKDVFINLTILFHVYVINKKIDVKTYKKFLYFLILPFLALNMLSHENQVFFIPFHFLITLYFFSNKENKAYNLKHLKSYIFLLIPIIILLLTSGTYDQLSIINNSIKEFNTTIPNQFAGNINLAIGGFVKWHFFFHDVNNFLRLFFCFSLSLFFIYINFDYLIKNKILRIHYSLIDRYLIILLPSFLILFLMLDHGRSLQMLSMHFISFYLLLDIKTSTLKGLLSKINNNYFLQKLIILFIIFYLNFWYLPQGGGFTGIGNFTTIYKGTLANELLNIFLIVFNYIDAEVINLPRIVI